MTEVNVRNILAIIKVNGAWAVNLKKYKKKKSELQNL